MSDTNTEALTLDHDLPHPPEKIWRALTDPALLAQWLLPVNGFSTNAGTPFTLQAPPQPGWDGTVNCKLLDSDPPRRLSYTWIVGDIDTIVTFTLTPMGAHTRLNIVQSGFKSTQKHNLAGAQYGWGMFGERLIGLLSNI
jgi:uncharacterized protein YndB with AHSA1/START domain